MEDRRRVALARRSPGSEVSVAADAHIHGGRGNDDQAAESRLPRRRATQPVINCVRQSVTWCQLDMNAAEAGAIEATQR